MGSNVAMTLDSKLQEATEKALADVTTKINNGKGGSAADQQCHTVTGIGFPYQSPVHLIDSYSCKSSHNQSSFPY